MTNQTLNAITSPNHIPIPIAVFLPPPEPMPKVIDSCKYPFSQPKIKPESIVASAAHLK